MNSDELQRISEIDRSEHITRAYEVSDGGLIQIEVDWQVSGWIVDGDGDHSLEEQVKFCRSHLDRGGQLLGAFGGGVLAGVALVQPRLRDQLAQLASLYVSRAVRRRGIACRLFKNSCDIAREAGATRMYVSFTPSSFAVGFYITQGCAFAEEVEPDLYALEPEDIHLILDL
jgi:predicted GNAT superfamily acetyltransferase